MGMSMSKIRNKAFVTAVGDIPSRSAPAYR
jgi:hypothetical protein